jgi:hypothetical protein
MSDFEILEDRNGREIRLTDERWAHIVGHIEMIDQQERIAETLAEPDSIISTVHDSSVHVYQKFYLQTPVTSKYMLVAVKILEDDAFIVTAFYSRKVKKGDPVWQK